MPRTILDKILSTCCFTYLLTASALYKLCHLQSLVVTKLINNHWSTILRFRLKIPAKLLSEMLTESVRNTTKIIIKVPNLDWY